MALSERDREPMRMANGVLMEWISGHPDDFSVQEALSRYDEPDAAAMVLGGLIPIAGTVVQTLAKRTGVTPESILQGIAKGLA